MSIPENFPVVPDHLDPTYNVDTYRELARLRARVTSLEAALRPLACLNDFIPDKQKDSDEVKVRVLVRHVRAARLALAPRSERREGEPCKWCRGGKGYCYPCTRCSGTGQEPPAAPREE